MSCFSDHDRSPRHIERRNDRIDEERCKNELYPFFEAEARPNRFEAPDERSSLSEVFPQLEHNRADEEEGSSPFDRGNELFKLIAAQEDDR